MAMLQLKRRCGPLSAEQESVIRSLPLHRLETLAEARLDVEGMADLNACLAANARVPAAHRASAVPVGLEGTVGGLAGRVLKSAVAVCVR